MKTLFALTLLTSVITLSYGGETKIAVLNLNDVEEMVKITVLAKPENVEDKKAIAENDKKMAEIHKAMNENKNDKDSMKATMNEMQKLNEQRRESDQKIERQVKAEIIRICKEATKGKYSVILNADYISESIITKDAELIDITIDVKEFMLTK